MQRQSLQTCLVGLSLAGGLLADGVVYVREVVVMPGDDGDLGWHKMSVYRISEYMACV